MEGQLDGDTQPVSPNLHFSTVYNWNLIKKFITTSLSYNEKWKFYPKYDINNVNKGVLVVVNVYIRFNQLDLP